MHGNMNVKVEVSGQLHVRAPVPPGKSPVYLSNKRLDRPQRRSGFFELEKNPLSLPGIEALLLFRPYRNLFTIPTDLTRLYLSHTVLKNLVNRLLRHVESSRKSEFNNANHEWSTDSRPLRQRTKCQQNFNRFCYHYGSVHSLWCRTQPSGFTFASPRICPNVGLVWTQVFLHRRS
jgi:hypothetical protein